MSANQLTVISSERFLALQGGGDVMEALEANLGPGAGLREADLTRVKIPAGGGTTWTIPNILGDEECKVITGVLCFMCIRGLIWKSEEPEEGSLPVLVSHDLKTAQFVMDQKDVPQHLLDDIVAATNEAGEIQWELLPQTQFGTGKNGHGKYAKEQRVLYILREQDTLPLVLAISPGSLQDWKAFVIEMTKAGIPYYRAVVSLSLIKDTSAGGQTFSQVVPKLEGVLSKEEGKLILDNITPTAKAAAASSFE